ncbi:MAG: hypothetical protein L3J12_06245 [Spirochaetales bacterium]|nr:hypothetical protein [Spirochaetales bacterium]
MKNKVLILVLAGFILLLAGCSGNSLKGKYVDVWDFHQEKDAVSVYEFSRNGDVVQSLVIEPFEELNFKGVEDVISGKYEIKDNNLSIILSEGSYEMQILEKTKESLTFGIPQADGSVWERKFLKE